MKNLCIQYFNLIFYILIFLVINISTVLAAEPEPKSVQHSIMDRNWDIVTDRALETSRAGFVLSNGVIIDISFDKTVFVNGIEKSNSYFQAPQNVSLVKNGELNVNSEFQNAVFQSVIQNTLDNQVLKTIHTINIDIKNLGHAKNALNNSAIYNLYFLPNPAQ